MQEPVFYAMKEFGLYTIKQKYIDEFSKIDESLKFLKSNRPFICIKVTAERRNWLIPVASINPDSSDYITKANKYRTFAELDKQQAKQDGNTNARAIHIVRDLTELQKNPDFLSVIEYYNALPVKHKYCKKYRDDKRNHIIISDPKLRKEIKKSLIVNIKAMKKGEQVGFIKAQINEGYINFKNYPKKSIAIGEALYKDHIALKKAEREKRERVEQQRAEAARKRELRNTVQGVKLEEQIEIEPQRIVGRTENGDVIIKLPGKNPEDVKTKVILPKGSITLDKDGTHVIGTTLEQQKKFNFKLPGGLRRILK